MSLNCLNCLISFPGLDRSPTIAALKSLPDQLKAHPEGLMRLPYFFASANAGEVIAGLSAGSLPVSGPFTVIHAVRRAGDLILEEAACEGLSLQLEVAGKRLPELPARSEVEALLKQDQTFVVVDGKLFKPGSEVFPFQSVYDDTVRFIEGLKQLGVHQDAMALHATADEIAIEVHKGVFGFGDDPLLPERYRALLHRLGGIKRGDRGNLKTADRTILLRTAFPDFQILVPGSVHPLLHRPKVGVGQAHFAYGTAAFSDFCGKKRSIDECIKELKVWLKFIETEIAPIPTLKEFVTSIETLERPRTEDAQPSSRPPSPAAGGFRSLASEARELLPGLGRPTGYLAAPWSEMNRSLGGGWSPNAVHVIAGPREEGKAALLFNQAMAAAPKTSILYMSHEHNMSEFIARLAAWSGKVSMAHTAARRAGANCPEAETALQKFLAIAENAAANLGECLFFRGTDSSIDLFDLNSLGELVKMLPSGKPRLLLLESIPLDEIRSRPGFASQLRRKACDLRCTILMSIHTPSPTLARPHIIEGFDLELLHDWQASAESVISLKSEKINLKKFLAMSQGKVDPALAEKLETSFLQAAGGLRLKGDTYTIARVIHSRLGVRQAILYLYQREIQRFCEGPALGLGHP